MSLKMFAKILILASMLSSSLGFLPSIHRPNTNAPIVVSLEMVRKPFISGNWKLNPQTKSEAITLATDISAAITSESPNADVAVFVPYPFIDSVMSKVGGKIFVGGEVCVFIVVIRHRNALSYDSYSWFFR